MFEERREQLIQYWNGEGFISIYQALLMCEMVNKYTLSTARVACTSTMETKYDNNCGDRRKIGNDGQVEGFNPGKIFQRSIGLAQNIDQIRGQVTVTEELNNTQEEYLQLHFIASIKSEKIPVFEASIRRPNTVVQMSKKFPHLKLPT